MVIEEATGIEHVQKGNARVYVSGGCLYVENAADGATVIIHDLAGRKVKTERLQEGHNRFALPSGTYIMNCNNSVTKVIL